MLRHDNLGRGLVPLPIAILLACWLALTGIAVQSAQAAEKLFDFGDLNVDLSKVQAKPSTEQTGAGAPADQGPSPARTRPTRQLPSTPESPAPAVLPRDGQEAIDETIRSQAVKVSPSRSPRRRPPARR
jgi:hypothetical protein